MGRMDPADLRAELSMRFYELSAKANDEGGRDDTIKWSVNTADLLLVELERTAPKADPDPRDYNQCCPCGRPWTYTDNGGYCVPCLKARAEAAEAQVEELLDPNVMVTRTAYGVLEAQLAGAKAEVERLKKLEAETAALDLSLGMRGLGTLLKNLEQHLGENVIFDPEAAIREQVLRDGIRFGRMLAEYLVAKASAAGLGPEPVADQWDKMILEAISHGLTPPGQ